MCGILGICDGKLAAAVEHTLDTLGHRGPDGRGLWSDPHHSFGHTRLSVIDLEGGAQPMADLEGRKHIVFNGEIYNYRELRKALGEDRFATHSDTEVILGLCQPAESADPWVRQLDGMFAFAVTDGEDLVLARDPLGIKPLYVGQSSGALAFASEIKALRKLPGTVVEFPPGHVYTKRHGLQRYYRLEQRPQDVTDPEEARTMLQALLDEAVRKRLIADVPVGIFLSGGLDSSMIAAIARRHKDPLETFSVGTEDSQDRPLALQMAEVLGTRHHERLYTIQEAIDALPRVIYHLESFDCALVRSAIPNFFLARLASEHVKVALAGEGADELFAGYEYLKAIPLEALDAELLQITANLHNTNLQRCDRMSMAHGLEVRVPFLDVRVVEYALRIPAPLKQYGLERTEKWILRKVAERFLPQPIAWRRKVKFASGAGLGDKLAAFAEEQITDTEFQRQRNAPGGVELRSKEELYYYRIFREMYPEPALLPQVGRSRSV